MSMRVPVFRLGVFVDDEAGCALGQDLQSFEKFDDGAAFVRAEGFEGLARSEGFAGVGEDGFAHGGELAVMQKGARISRAPEFAGDEFGVALEESG